MEMRNISVRSDGLNYTAINQWFGVNGDGWSNRTVANDATQNSFALNFDASVVHTSMDFSYYTKRYWGRPLRCLVR